MLLFTTVLLVALGMQNTAVDATAKPSFALYNKNLLYGFRPEENAKNLVEGGGVWTKTPNYGKPEEPVNNAAQGVSMLSGVEQPTGRGDYTMFFKNDNHTRCEECVRGVVKGTMVVNDHGVHKMINYEALSPDSVPSESNPSDVSKRSPLDELASSSRTYSQNQPQMMMANGVPIQMSQLGLQQPEMQAAGQQQVQQLVAQQLATPQQLATQQLTSPQQVLLPQQLAAQQIANQQLASQQITAQQNDLRYLISQAGGPPQNQIPLNSYNQLQSAMSNAAQTNPALPQLPDTTGLPQANQMMPNQQWNEAVRLIQSLPANAPASGDLTGAMLDTPNMAAAKKFWQGGVAVPMVFVTPTSGRTMLSFANLGGSPTKDSNNEVVVSKEQTTEFKTEDTPVTNEVNTEMLKKLVNMIERMPKTDDVKEPTEAVVPSTR